MLLPLVSHTSAPVSCKSKHVAFAHMQEPCSISELNHFEGNGYGQSDGAIEVCCDAILQNIRHFNFDRS